MITVGVGVLVRDGRGRVLLGLRTKPGEPDVWSFPGGAIEDGESFEDAGIRELREETGLVAAGVDVVGLLVADGPALTAVGVARDVRGTPSPTEPHVHAAWEWFARDEIPAELFGPTRMALALLDDDVVPGSVATYDLRFRQQHVPRLHDAPNLPSMAHTHHHRHDAFDDAGLAELLDLDARIHAAHLDEIVALVAAHAPEPTRVVVDLGAGTGDGSARLARFFPDATVVAVDGSAGMVERLRGLERVTPVHADLDAGWPPGIGAPDVVWAATSLHHLADPERMLRDVLGALAPGGLLAVVEMDHQPRFLPDGDGLEDRLHAAVDTGHMNPHPDWTDTLARTGFELVDRRRSVFAPDPAPEGTRRYAELFFDRMLSGTGARLSPADRAALERIPLRDDLRPHGSRTTWLARRPLVATRT